jgi:hypothetical protein
MFFSLNQTTCRLLPVFFASIWAEAIARMRLASPPDGTNRRFPFIIGCSISDYKINTIKSKTKEKVVFLQNNSM